MSKWVVYYLHICYDMNGSVMTHSLIIISRLQSMYTHHLNRGLSLRCLSAIAELLVKRKVNTFFV